MASNTPFTTIRTEGALLPPDLLARIADNQGVDGISPDSYHHAGERLNEVINQSWNALQGAWANFQSAREKLPDGDPATSITRERWLLPLFRELEYGRLQTASAADFVIEGKNYPISHKTPEGVPVHLVGCGVRLDERTAGVAGAARTSPHSLVQVLLNRSEAHIWGFVSNGFRLRLLRDNVSLTRQAYLEFDLQAMMDGEVYSDFVLLWLVCHQSRVEGGRDCWLERWVRQAQEQGTRALDQLRDGVQTAIEALGVGFLEHPANTALRDRLEGGALDKQDYYRQLLRLVYRLLFLFTAEDRNLLYDPDAPESARDLYRQHYSTARLRRMAEKVKGTRHADLYEALRLVMRLLGGETLPLTPPRQQGGELTPPLLTGEAGRGLALPVLGSYLFRDEAVTDIISAQIANVRLLDAVRALAFVEDRAVRKLRPIDYRNLGPEELGSVYESLLELHPQVNIVARTFALATAGGNERKTTGSYYTPTSLINALLDSALNPVLDEAMKKGEVGILALKVCDPACGSGHFLIAAANRMAKALAYVRTGEEEPPPAAIQAAKRDIIGHCIYGVDINPMAVELCKVNLWMEALEPGKPLTFLDHRIQVGNSLLGTTPALMANGIPDDAFNPIEGDDPKYASAMKKVNKKEREQREKGVRQLGLFEDAPAARYDYLTRAMHELDGAADDTPDAVRRKEAQYAALANDPEYVKARLLADAWCAAFVWEKKASPRPDADAEGQGVRVLPLPMTDLLYRRMEENPLAENLQSVREYVVELKERYQFFHWHVAFPDVFTVDSRHLLPEGEGGEGVTGWVGGFDVVLGNPPWEKINFKDEEYFAVRFPEIANAQTKSKRKKLIDGLQERFPDLYHDYITERNSHDYISSFFRFSGTFPLTGVSRINLYSVFAELVFDHRGI
jgi:methylase of polypeptide subunit release factors